MKIRFLFMISFIFVISFFLAHYSYADDFVLADSGCPMSHCDPQMSDNSHLPVPKGDKVGIVWARNQLSGEAVGSSWGLGCTSNGSIAACTYRGDSDNLVVYDFDGKRLYASGTLLNKEAWKSVPIIDRSGRIIACDDTRVVMLDLRANPIKQWESLFEPKAPPISPVIIESGTILLATQGGPLSAYDSVTGKRVAPPLALKLNPEDPRFFETMNTPGSRGNRVYVSTQLEGIKTHGIGRLYAVDVDASNRDESERLKVVWYYEFDAPSGASPLVIDDTIYFDGYKNIPGKGEVPYIFAVSDRGNYCVEKWAVEVSQNLQASCARDPRGGIWSFPTGEPWLEHRNQETGELIERINVSELINERGYYMPGSAMTIAGDDPLQPVMVVCVWGLGPFGKHYIVAIDLNSRGLLWKVPFSAEPNGFTAGQFPIITRNGESRVVFSSLPVGARAIGEVKQPATDQGLIKAPAAPSGLAVSAYSTSQINLSWNDNANNESGFKIERSVAFIGPWAEIITLGPNVSSYSNTRLSRNTAYYYRVRSFNAGGKSAYSNVAITRTKSR